MYLGRLFRSIFSLTRGDCKRRVFNEHSTASCEGLRGVFQTDAYCKSWWLTQWPFEKPGNMNSLFIIVNFFTDAESLKMASVWNNSLTVCYECDRLRRGFYLSTKIYFWLIFQSFPNPHFTKMLLQAQPGLWPMQTLVPSGIFGKVIDKKHGIIGEGSVIWLPPPAQQTLLLQIIQIRETQKTRFPLTVWRASQILDLGIKW